MEDDLTVSNLPDIFKLNTNSNNINTDNNNNNISNTQRNKNIVNIVKLRNYFQDSYNLETQAIRNSFGKMILSKSDSSPRFSFGKEKRFYQDFTEKENEFYTRLFDKLKNQKKGILNNKELKHKNFDNKKDYLEKIKIIKLSSGNKCPSEFLYYLPPTNIYKYPFLPKFSFGKSLRDLQKPIKKYDFYKLRYDKKTDDEGIDKKWRKRIVGGDIGIEDRFNEDKKIISGSITPGPGKYNPDYDSFKYKQNKYGYMGIKLNEDKNSIIIDRPKNISFDAYNIKHLIGNKYNHKINDNHKKKILMNNIRLQFLKKEKSNINENSKNNINKIIFRNNLISFKENLSFINRPKINLSFNKNKI